MISVENLRVVYHDVISVINGVSLRVDDGEVVVLIGANGAGKTTLLRAICGLIEVYDGDILEGDIRSGEGSLVGLDSMDIIKRHRITYVMEDRPVFQYLTIEENLEAAAFSRKDKDVKADIEYILETFPALKLIRNKKAGYASGGEQQMLAIGMGLMTRPQCLLLDEPSLGLAPLIVEELFKIIHGLNKDGLTILLVEQNAHAALNIGHRGYVMETGRIVLDGTAEELLNNEDVREFYLGAGERERKSYKDAKRYKRRKRWL
jgi:branched-chain amino acid transport system ATP-binding protein